MNFKRNTLILVFFALLIFSVLTILYLQVEIGNTSFIMGILLALVLVTLAFILFYLPKKDVTSASAINQSGNVPILTWFSVIAILIIGGLASIFFINNRNELAQTKLQSTDLGSNKDADMIESMRNSSLVYLMSNILDKIDDELKNNPKRTLSEETIARIAALSYSFKPYSFSKSDSLKEKKYSPERGQLLLALSKMNLDSITFDKIKYKASFANAELALADLRGANLRGVDLNGANLKEADLRRANLKKASLKWANFWGANLQNADLQNANFKRANLSWSDLKKANFRGANLSGAIFESAVLSKAKMAKADLTWAHMNGAFLNEVDMSGLKMQGADLTRANLVKTNFNNADLTWVDFKEANLSRANLKNATLSGSNLSQADLYESDMTKANLYKATVEEENWLEKLEEWKIIGAEDLQNSFYIIPDQSGEFNYRILPGKKEQG